VFLQFVERLALDPVSRVPAMFNRNVSRNVHLDVPPGQVWRRWRGIFHRSRRPVQLGTTRLPARVRYSFDDREPSWLAGLTRRTR
jgi:hypothetical protein